jgi:hypothetical protein
MRSWLPVFRSLRSTRLGLLLMAFLLVAAVTLPTPARSAGCCTYVVVVTYYSSAAHTTQVGSCTLNEFCSGTDYCTGNTRTGYYTSRTAGCCLNCGE